MRMRATNPKAYLLPNRMFVASGFSSEKMLNCNLNAKMIPFAFDHLSKKCSNMLKQGKGRKTSPFHLHPGVAIVTTSKGST